MLPAIASFDCSTDGEHIAAAASVDLWIVCIVTHPEERTWKILEVDKPLLDGGNRLVLATYRWTVGLRGGKPEERPED